MKKKHFYSMWAKTLTTGDSAGGWRTDCCLRRMVRCWDYIEGMNVVRKFMNPGFLCGQRAGPTLCATGSI